MLDLALLEPEVIAIRSALATTEGLWGQRFSFQHYQHDTRSFIYDCYPYLFLAAFPTLTPATIRPLALAGRLFATSVFLVDGIMDGQSTAEQVTVDLLRHQALQFEAYQALYSLFPPDNAFWPQLRGYLAAYADACLLEKTFVQGSRPWSEFTETISQQIITGKCGIAKAVVAGLATLAGQEELLPPLTTSIDHYYLAFQMWDDLQDWKEDIVAGSPSLLLARLLADSPDCQAHSTISQETIAHLTRKLYYHKHAHYVLQAGLRSLQQAQSAIAALPSGGWQAVLLKLQYAYQQMITDLDTIIAKNLKRTTAAVDPYQPAAI